MRARQIEAKTTDRNAIRIDEVRWHPLHMLSGLWSKRSLIAAMTRREIEGRYKGSLGGVLWFVVNNLVLLAIYSFVFGVIFKARWQAAGIDTAHTDVGFAMPLFIGLITYNIFAETVNRAPGLIISNINYVKKVVFPLETLSVVSLGSALFNTGIGLLVLVALGFVVGTPVSWKIVYLPVIILPVVLLTLGLSWFLASIGVYIRDTAQIVMLGVTMMMFLSPIFYPPAMLSEKWRVILYANPMTLPIEQARAAILFGQTPNFFALGLLTLIGLLVTWLGWLWFEKTRKGFADVI